MTVRMGADRSDSRICCDEPAFKIKAVLVAVVDICFDEVLVEGCEVLLACIFYLASSKETARASFHTICKGTPTTSRIHYVPICHTNKGAEKPWVRLSRTRFGPKQVLLSSLNKRNIRFVLGNI
jgi:hypothetical protein